MEAAGGLHLHGCGAPRRKPHGGLKDMRLTALRRIEGEEQRDFCTGAGLGIFCLKFAKNKEKQAKNQCFCLFLW
jgi:hypothetical protein